MIKLLKNESGVIALSLTLIVMLIGITIVLSLVFVFLNRLEAARNLGMSEKAYFAAESGIEDALLRIRKNLNWTSPITLNLSNGSVTTTIPVPIGGSRVITSDGNVNNRIRRVSATHGVSSSEVSFFYGAQVGDGGAEMRNGSVIRGNMFSNGTVFGSGTVTDGIIVAGNGNKIDGISVGIDANVHTCVNSTIGGILTYVSGGSYGSCTAASYVDGGPGEIAPVPFAISDSMMMGWKNDAAAGGTILGDYTVNSEESLGPIKIDGNLHVQGTELTMTGTIWVTGNFTTGTNVEVRLDESYGDFSGVLLASGSAEVRNNAELEGASSPSSYLLVIAESSSLVEADPAFEIRNNAEGSILFAPNGLMVINNNVELVEATAYQLLLKNNVEVDYEIGLENLEFTAGPSGGYATMNWKEE